jgi:ribosomal-protein-alanine N-acetyltransferase
MDDHMKKILETDRLYFRQFTVEDATILYEMHQDTAITKYTGDPTPWDSVELVKKILKEAILPQYEKNIGRWATFLKQDDTFIGWCGLKEVDGEVDLGYRFIQQYWGKGYATEAAKAVLQYGINNKIKNIVGRASVDNIASVKVLEKIGLTFFEFYMETEPKEEKSVKYICKESFLSH